MDLTEDDEVKEFEIECFHNFSVLEKLQQQEKLTYCVDKKKRKIYLEIKEAYENRNFFIEENCVEENIRFVNIIKSVSVEK